MKGGRDINARTPDILLDSPERLIAHITERLHRPSFRKELLSAYATAAPFPAAAVLFLLGHEPVKGRKRAEPCLILCERSRWVRQPGDLCFPGGGVMPGVDGLSARLLTLPGTPLSRWRHWAWWRRHHPVAARRIALFSATGLRESFEEMRTNPFGMTFINPLSPERLALFHQVIFPIAGWLHRRRPFRPNREVSRIIPLALGAFFNPAHYRCLRIENVNEGEPLKRDFICFTPPTRHGAVPLWGATLRMVFGFLGAVFDFKPPPLASLSVIQGLLHPTYITGQRLSHPPRTGLSIST